MEKDNPSDLSREIKTLLKGSSESLKLIRDGIFASIAFLIALFNRIIRFLKNWRISVNEQSIQLEKQRRLEEKERREIERKEKEEAKIAEERRFELREKREEERKLKDQRTTYTKIIYPILLFAAVSTTALVVGVSRLSPIARWTKSQNECIEMTSLDETNKVASLANKVMKCNGGHD